MKKYLLICLMSTILINFSAAWRPLQESTIQGKITDETGEGLIGVTVLVKETKKGAVTDINGAFEISISDGAETLVISYVGFLTQEIPINGKTILEITLAEDLGTLEEVVVTGYGQTQNKYLVTSSITSIKADKLIGDRPIPRLEQAIQGASPSVVVVQESGSPGAPQTIRMRGVGTAGDATPLMLMNGFQIPDLNFVNPNDIQGIQVYRDAASSAIYGARGGNGVLNFQTKSSSEENKLNVDFRSSYGVQSLASSGDYLNGQEYAQYYNNSYFYRVRQGLSTTGLRTPFTDEEILRLPNTTWIEEISNDAVMQDHHLSASGKISGINYYIGGGLFDQEGIIGNTDFGRKSLTLSLNTKLLDKLEVNLLGMYSGNRRRFIPENSENSRLMSAVASLPGIYPVYAESGSPFNNGMQAGLEYNGVPLFSIAEFGNPILGLTHSENKALTDTYFGNMLLSYDLTNEFRLNTSYGYFSRTTDTKGFSQTFDYPDQGFVNPINTLNESAVEEKYLQWEGYLSYTATLGTNHNIDLVAGTSVLSNEVETSGRNGANFSVNEFDEVSFDDIIDPAEINENIPSAQKNTTLSYYGRVNYNFKERYLFGITMRADGSSKFGPDNRWGYFPSVSAGWLISDESFMSKQGIVSLLKLRGSWGVNGNDRIAPYQWIDRYVLLGSVGAEQPQRQDFNPDIKWEEITQTNIGLDVDLFKNKIGLTFDYYIKETEDMLIDFPNPGFTGLPDPTRNAASVRNRGFEAIFLYRDDIASKVNFELGFNVGFSNNEITALNGGLPLTGANTRVFRDAPDLSYSNVGDPIASFYGYRVERLDNTGNPIYQDLSGPDGVPDGQIDPEYDRTIIGNPYPDMIYGITLNMNWNGFDLSTFISGSQGNDIVNASMGYGFAFSNRTREVLDAWSVDNTSSAVFRPSASETVNHEFSDYYVEDGSYTRVKNITVGYTLPASLVSKAKLEKIRVFISGNNLFTLTDYSGFDPEIGVNNDPRDVGVDRGFYPQAKSIIGGLQISF